MFYNGHCINISLSPLKRIKNLLTISFVIILLSCSENSTESPKPKTLSDYIIGKWVLDSAYVNGRLSLVEKGTQITFFKDFTIKMKNVYNIISEVDWEINEQDSTLLWKTSTGNILFKIYTLNDSNLIWDWWFDINTYSIDFLHKVYD